MSQVPLVLGTPITGTPIPSTWSGGHTILISQPMPRIWGAPCPPHPSPQRDGSPPHPRVLPHWNGRPRTGRADPCGAGHGAGTSQPQPAPQAATRTRAAVHAHTHAAPAHACTRMYLRRLEPSPSPGTRLAHTHTHTHTVLITPRTRVPCMPPAHALTGTTPRSCHPRVPIGTGVGQEVTAGWGLGIPQCPPLWG